MDESVEVNSSNSVSYDPYTYPYTYSPVVFLVGAAACAALPRWRHVIPAKNKYRDDMYDMYATVVALHHEAQVLAHLPADYTFQLGAGSELRLDSSTESSADGSKDSGAERLTAFPEHLLHHDWVCIVVDSADADSYAAARILAQHAKMNTAFTIGLIIPPESSTAAPELTAAAARFSALASDFDFYLVSEPPTSAAGPDYGLIWFKFWFESMYKPGYIILDFPDFWDVMSGRGRAMMGYGVGQGANFITDAVQQALYASWIDQTALRQVTGFIVCAFVNRNFPITNPITKLDQISKEIQNYVDKYNGEEASSRYGVVYDDQIAEDQIVITILITGNLRRRYPEE